MSEQLRTSAHLRLASNLRQLRAERGLSQEQLAIRADIARGYYGALERGEHSPSLGTLVKLAQALDTQLSRVVEGIPAEAGSDS
jgi:transcriptional regulator with XRE-family HTH domain